MAASVTSVMKGAEEQGNFFSRMAWYYQMGLLLGLVVLLIFATDALLYSDTRAETAKLQEEVQGLKAKNAQGNIIRQNLAAAEKTLKEKREEIDQLRDFLPDQVEISKVYDSIKDFMREQKLEVRKFAPSKETPQDFYTSLPIQVQVTGSYDNLGQFFSRLGFFTRIVSVSDVNIKQAEDGAQEYGRSINSSFVVTAYYISQANLEKLTMKQKPAPQPDKKENQPKK
ncbi:MAG: type 4a pilus biogenesis protein PilO [Blastocatellia bacterium]|nr:type 4a pilus biogenesis protein PilO [Blastocatellia bacterium]